MIFAVTDEHSGDSVVWRTSATGQLEGTVVIHEGRVERVSDDKAVSQFNAEKNYFTAKQRDDMSSTSQLPAATHAPAVLRAERFVIANHPWVMAVIAGAVIYAVRPVVRR